MAHRHPLPTAAALALLAVATMVRALPAQSLDGLAGEAILPRYELADIRPEVHRWYLPRHLPESAEMPWYVSDTQYARDAYRRYVAAGLEGYQWYDYFGNPVGRGWLLYEWSQEQEHPKGSSIWKSREYSRLLQRLVIAQDGGRHGDVALMVGDQIHTTFTPLTFSKPRFNGMRMDWASDMARGSLILSRPSWPDADDVQGTLLPSERKNFTNLMGGHAEVQALPALWLGATYVNAHLGQTKQEFGVGSPISGSLTTDQNNALKTLWVRLRDDSPADGRAGALLFDWDVILVDTTGHRTRGREIGFLPIVEGGIARGSSLAADGSESILLTYDLNSLDDPTLQGAGIRRVIVELFVANDYRIEMASDRQTDAELRSASPVFLTCRRAPGNVQDNSNAAVVRLDYGLPTATEVVGVNWNLVDWGGLSVQGEIALSRRHRSYPNQAIRRHHRSVDQAEAAYVQAAFDHYPWSLFVEGYSIAAAYTTTAWLTPNDGKIRFADPTQSCYELVDDDDDFDAYPEWIRYQQPSSSVAWPGYDENADLLYDYNQNANLYPDYEEPFLRFRADRPQYLPGLDMNYNGTVDRFENDELPDYPYPADRRGVNLYASTRLTPDVSLTAGGQRVDLLAGSGRTRAGYVLWRGVRRLPRGGRARLVDHLALVQDDIPDPLRQWVQPAAAAGRMVDVPDELPARDTWIHDLYADLEHRVGPDVRFQHRLRWTRRWQRDGDEALADREARRRSGFLGLIDKVEWSLPVGLAVLEPRWKSEFRWERPHSRRLSTGAGGEQTVSVLWRQPLLAESTRVAYFPRFGRQVFSTELQLGAEKSWFRLFDGAFADAETDYGTWTAIVQITNRTAYQGYALVSRAGLQLSRRQLPDERDVRRNLFYFTVNAGLD